MNSLKLTAIGNLAKNPELVAKGDVSYTRLCVIGNDFAGKDEDGSPREVVTSVWFVAFGGLGEAIANNARKGDQLILDARIRSNNWIDPQGEWIAKVRHLCTYSIAMRSSRWPKPPR